MVNRPSLPYLLINEHMRIVIGVGMNSTLGYACPQRDAHRSEWRIALPLHAHSVILVEPIYIAPTPAVHLCFHNRTGNFLLIDIAWPSTTLSFLM